MIAIKISVFCNHFHITWKKLFDKVTTRLILKLKFSLAKLQNISAKIRDFHSCTILSESKDANVCSQVLLSTFSNDDTFLNKK